MKRTLVGSLIPSALILAAFVMTRTLNLDPPVSRGIQWGLFIALLQSWPSVLLQRWAWDKKSFFAVWGGAILFRMVVFGLTAFVVYRYTSLSFVATLIALISATTIFLVSESLLVKLKK